MRSWAHASASGVSPETPAAPCAWIARSTHVGCGPRRRDLDRGDLGARALRPDGVDQPGGLEHEQPGLVDRQPGLRDPLLHDAVLCDRRRRTSIGAAARAHIISSARSAMPEAAHAVVDAARAEPGLRHHEAAALRAEQVVGRHPDVVEVDDAVAAVRAVVVAEHRRRALRRVTPGVSSGTRIIECRAYLAASGSLTPITIATLHSGRIAPVDHHLRPLTT